MRRPAHVRRVVRAWVIVMLSAAACSSDDSSWKGGLQMTVNWSHYTDATQTCRRIEAERTGKEPGSIEPEDSCLRIDGKSCYVLTSDSTKDIRFGQLVRNCFDIRQSVIEREK
jgi:hypothetical protein